MDRTVILHCTVTVKVAGDRPNPGQDAKELVEQALEKVTFPNSDWHNRFAIVTGTVIFASRVKP